MKYARALKTQVFAVQSGFARTCAEAILKKLWQIGLQKSAPLGWSCACKGPFQMPSPHFSTIGKFPAVTGLFHQKKGG